MLLLLLLQAYGGSEALCVAAEEPTEGLVYLLAQQSCLCLPVSTVLGYWPALLASICSALYPPLHFKLQF